MAASTPPASLSDWYKTLDPSLRKIIPPTGALTQYTRWACAKWPITPPLMHFAAGCVILAHETARFGLHVRPSPAFKAPLICLRCVFVADSAAGKSSAIHAAQLFHGDLRDRSFGKFRADGSMIPNPWMNLAGSEQGLEAALVKHYDAALDSTPIIGHHEELTSLLRGTGRQSYGANEDWYNMVFDGLSAAARTENTKAAQAAQAEHGRAEHPIVQGLFASTPVAMRRVVTDVHREGGLLSRMHLWVSGKGNGLPLPFSSESEEEAYALAGALYDAAFDAWDTIGAFFISPDTTRTIAFDREAREVANEFIVRVNAHARNSEMGAARVRSSATMLVNAALMAVSRAADPERRDVVRDQILVRKDDAERAVAFVETSWKTQETIYDETTAITQAGSVSIPTVRFQERVLEVIREAGPDGITLTALRQRCEKWAAFNTIVFKTLMNDLQDAETSPVEVKRLQRTGRPSTRLRWRGDTTP